MDVQDLLDRARAAPGGRLVTIGLAPRAERVALLPASFDPLTVGHAALVDAALREGSLVVLLYSVRTLSKEGDPAPPLLAEPARIQALEAFAATRPSVMVALTGAGLLVEQAEAAARTFPGATLEVLAGSDKVLQVFDPSWYDDLDRALDRLFAVATLRYAVRAGDEGKVERASKDRAGRVLPIDADPAVAGVSSRDVRERRRRGEDVSGLVPPEVLPFLASGP